MGATSLENVGVAERPVVALCAATNPVPHGATTNNATISFLIKHPPA
jgi:hypothetical protein